MLDLNDIRVFEKVAALTSFSGAATALGLPRSTVSRSVARLERQLGVRLLQRTTREVVLTSAGAALAPRCTHVIHDLGAALADVEQLTARPRGQLRVATSTHFAFHVLAGQLPEFSRRYPEVELQLELGSRRPDLVAEAVDVAVRIGPLSTSDTGMVAIRLGSITRCLCAAPSYLAHHPAPRTPNDLAAHAVIETPGEAGRPRTWSLERSGKTRTIEVRPRICVNDVLLVHQLVANGAGIGVLAGYLSDPEIAAGRLVRVLPAWSVPPVAVSIVFPTRRELAPSVRAFVDFMKEINAPGRIWYDDRAASR